MNRLIKSIFIASLLVSSSRWLWAQSCNPGDGVANHGCPTSQFCDPSSNTCQFNSCSTECDCGTTGSGLTCDGSHHCVPGTNTCSGACAPGGGADLVAVSMTSNPSSTLVGNNVTITFQGNNNGPQDPGGINANVSWPSTNFSLVTYSVTPSGYSCSSSASGVACGFTSAGAPLPITITVQLKAISAGVVSVSGSIGSNSGICDPAPGNENKSTPITLTNPAPSLTSLSPNAKTAGSGVFTLTLNGSGFVSGTQGSQVFWNGSLRTTTFISDTQLTASIPATDIASAGSANVTVVNPSPGGVGGGTSNTLAFTTYAQPVITSFTASPLTIAKNQSSVLAWNVTGASQISIDQGVGIVSPSGNKTVTPGVTTTYTLTATNSLGAFVTQTVTVTVACNNLNCPTPPNICLPDQTCSTPLAPVINSFTASPLTIAKGQISTLAWTTTNATIVTIDHGVGSVSLNGNTAVSPALTTTYTLTATNSAGVTATKTVTVTIACNNLNCPTPPNICLPDQTCSTPPAPVINTFTATPDTIAKGQSSTLAWDVSNAVTVSIDHGIGLVNSVANTAVSPTVTTIYTLTATNSAGVTATKTVTVTIACNNLNCPTPPNICLPDQTCSTPLAPVINTFTATPDTIAKGQSSTLAWTTTNAVTVTIDQGIGSVSINGNASVSPTVTTIYTLTAMNTAGVTATRTVTVTVSCNNLNCPTPPNICLPDQSCVTPPAPVINTFTATPDTIAKGQSSTLAWTTTNAATVSIDQGVGSVAINGNTAVSPTATTIYTLTATNSGGVSTTKTVTVTVSCNNLNCPTPPNICLPDQSCVTPPAPVINTFTATPDTIAKGQSSTLAWTTTNAATVSIDQGIGAVLAVGNTSVGPTATTIYTLTATNSAGVAVTKTVTVTVSCNNLNCPTPPNICLPDQSCFTPPAPVINTFTATPDTIAKGQSSTLAWTTTNAVTVTIDQGVGSVSLNGNASVSPLVTTLYTLTATNSAGVTATKTVTVTVACNNLNCPTPPNICLPDQSCVTPPAPVINTFTATPDTIAKGQSSTLAWTTTNAATVSIDQSVGPVSINGNTSVSPTATTIYTLTAANSAGVSVTKTITVTVACNNLNCPTPPNICLPDQSCVTPPVPVINTFTATPDTIAKGQSSTLAWTTTNAATVSIDQSVGPVSLNGNTSVSPTATTIYTLTATNSAGVMTTKTVTVAVACNNLNCPNPPNICLPDQTCSTPPAPVINTFTATPDTIAKGQNATLAWTTTNAVTVTIDQGIGSVSINGNASVSPTVTTIYTLTATNTAGVTATKTVTVTVSCNNLNCPTPPNICLPDQTCSTPPAPVINTFTATPDTIAKGQNSTLAWTTMNAMTVTIDQGVGSVSINGNTPVSPTITTIYTLTATNIAGVTAIKTVTVTVSCNNLNCPTPPNICLPDQSCVTPPAPVINTFTATPDTIAKGQSSTLAWTTSNAATLSIDQGVGSVAINGNAAVSPAITTIYTLTATNSAGISVTKAITVTVACNNLNCPNPPNICLPDQSCLAPAAPVINSFIATPDTIIKGQSSTLAWNVSNAVTVSIDQGVGVVSLIGNTVVSPIVTTAYTLTATNSAGVSVSKSITVTLAGIDHITVEPDGKTINLGDSLQFIAHAFAQNGQEILGVTFTWQTLGAAGTISNAGSFHSFGGYYGSRVYTVTATENSGKSGSARVTVLSPSPFASDICGAIAYPVPYKSNSGLPGVTFTHLAAGSKIRIFTSDARIVRTLYSQNGEDVLWDVRNDDGDKVASWVYFYIIEQNGPCGKKQGKLVIIQ